MKKSFWMFDYKKKLQKSRNENRKGFAISKLHTLFTGGKKLWYKPETKNFIVLLYYFILLSKVGVKQMTKAVLALGLGKSTFLCAIFRMYTQLHTQANHEILCNNFFLSYALILYTSVVQVFFTWIVYNKQVNGVM